MYGEGSYSKSKRSVVIWIIKTVVFAIVVANVAVWSYNVGGLDYSERNAKSYMAEHCELLSNPLNSADKWYECDQ